MGYHDAERLTLQRPWLLPALPNALGALCEQLERDELSPLAIVEILRCEPSLLVQTLHLAPATLPPGAPIDDYLSAAVTVLGKPGLELLISATLSRHLDQYLNVRLASEQRRHWRRAFSTALSAKHLATCFDPAQADIAYLCGLLSRVGQLCGIAPLQPVVEIMAYAQRPLAELEQALPLVKVISVAGNLSLDQNSLDGAFVSKLLARHAGLEPDVFEQALVAASTELTEIANRFSLSRGDGCHGGQGVEESALHPALIAFLSRRLESRVRQIAPSAQQSEESTPWPWLAQVLWARHEIAPLTVWRRSNDAVQPVLICCFTSVSAERRALLQRLPPTQVHAPGRALLGHEAVYLGVHARADASLADQQLLDVVGSAGLMCLSFGAEQGEYVLMGGLAHASVGGDQDALASEVIELAESLLPTFATAQAERQAAINSDRDASEPLSPEKGSTASQQSRDPELNQLMLRKTVHEIRTPLSVMKTYLGLLKQKIPESDSVRSELAILGEEIDRVNGLLGQLTESSQEESRQWVSVNQVVTDMLALIGRQHPSAPPVQIRTDLDPDLPAIFSLRDRIKQILLNLVKNALEAQPDGGVVEVTTRAGAGAPAPDSVILTVRDQGPGLSNAIRARLFEPFNSSKSDPGAGKSASEDAASPLGSAVGESTSISTPAARGLGLHIVRAAVSSLDGHIQVSSRSGEGTEFVVEFPVLTAAQGDGAKLAAPSDACAARDDDRPNEHRVGRIGRQEGAGRVVGWGRRALADND